MFEMRLLGQFSITFEGYPMELPSRQAQSLVAYLALNVGVAHRREKLAGLLWPEVPEADARRNLRRALYQIRKATGGQAPLRADDLTVAFDIKPQVWVDVFALSQKISPEQTVDELIGMVS